MMERNHAGKGGGGINICIVLKEIMCDGLDQMNLIRGKVHTVIMSLRRFLRSRRFFDKISDGHLFKNRSHPAEASVGQVVAP